MAVPQAGSEIPDSEDEPLSSSPQPVSESLDPPANKQNKIINHLNYQDTDDACEISKKPSEVRDPNDSPNNTSLPLQVSQFPKSPLSDPDSPQLDAISKVKKPVNDTDVRDSHPRNSFVSDPSIKANLHASDRDNSEKEEPQSQSTQPTRGSVEQKVAPPSKTPQEITIEELKVQKRTLIASLAALESVQELIAEDETSDFASRISEGEPSDSDVMTAANAIVKKHIKLLHNYNEIKDVGQGLMGLIADSRGVRIVEVQDEFGVSAKD